MVEAPVIAKAAQDLSLLPAMSNRHGLVAGATGTGKTVTLQVMAEALSAIGVPVFAADVKGDLSGISQPGEHSPKFDQRLQSLGLGDWKFSACPVVFWDVFGKEGHPVRTTVTELGPLLFSRILNLNDTQTGVLTLVFKIADDQGLLLLDMKDMQAMLQHVSANAHDYQSEYGNISAASIGAIQRGLVALGQQGGYQFFGEPALNIEDLLQVDSQGRGVVNILAADQLLQSPQLYATFLLWLISELFEKLPEVGDPEKPRLVFFFDEAHLLFNDLPSVLQSRIEQVVRLIRSKGVGVFFVTQNPIDVPETVLGQLGNRVQHALRAFSPRDQKAVKSAAETFRANPRLNVEEVITQLGVGEALVSFLDQEGIPAVVERARILPPHSQIGPITAEQRAGIIQNSVIAGVYEQVVDQESAYEKLKGKAAASSAPTAPRQPDQTSANSGWTPPTAAPQPVSRQAPPSAAPAHATAGTDWLQAAGSVLGNVLGSGSGRRETVVQAMAKSAARSIGSTVGRQIIRGVLGSMLGPTRR
jgi:DNA helicase HerA-like ATPase